MTIHAATRRELLGGAGVLFAWPFLPKIARAEGRDPRMLTIILRGALDGLAAVAPVGDPDWVKLRGDRALVLDGKTPALPLDSFFALNPAMPNLYRMFKFNEAAVVHAAATPYRDRSHFDGQDVLESGLPNPGRADSGWLNRALGGLQAEARVRSDRRAFAVGPVTPLVVRGPTPVLSWTPTRIQPASEDTMARLLDLYHHTDVELARVLEGRRDLSILARAGDAATMAPTEGRATPQGFPAQVRAFFADAAGTAAKFLAREDGPRIGALAFNGWDTHVDEGADSGRLATLLGALDGAIEAVRVAMGPVWSETVVTVITEFGRTARINGTNGTDHGTGTIALLAGGAVKGGRVIADWPGLKNAQLHEGRDLAATTDLRAVLKGLLKDHLRVTDQALAGNVFPGSGDVKAMAGLV
ncbi:MAG: hypothetical protein QOF14_3884 [Hyphomicrobiales bacterium]|jgi:uncharacterized protein (DUF1501 family)|nr:hypothetical protein [Hyphomicrobiales bacterium]